MAAVQSIPRFLLSRNLIHLRPPIHKPFAVTSASLLRHASSSSNPKTPSEQFRRRQQSQAPPPRPKKQATPVIPQPDQYRPPSHGKRTPRSETDYRSYGPPLTEEDKERMRTKKYPNMMSPEGSFSHWFINHQTLHAWISLGILMSLAVTAWSMNFRAKTIYLELLPTWKDFLRHPYATTSRFVEVYKMHVIHQTSIVQGKRARTEEEVEKRRLFRAERIKEAEARGEEYVEDPRYYIGKDGIRRRRVKRWFGIWE